jgi:hypothetical protein
MRTMIVQCHEMLGREIKVRQYTMGKASKVSDSTYACLIKGCGRYRYMEPTNFL